MFLSLQFLLMYNIGTSGNSTECKSEVFREAESLFACMFAYLKSQIQGCPILINPDLDLIDVRFLTTVCIQFRQE